MNVPDAPPPYSERPPAYERAPLMQAARQQRRAHQQDMYLDSFDRISKTEFGVIASIWCVGLGACFYFCCRP